MQLTQPTQVLPLVPPDPLFYSPYSGLDTNCGNPLLIDLEALITEGLLEEGDRPAAMPDGDVQFAEVAAAKQPLLQKAATTLLTSPKFAGEAAGRVATQGCLTVPCSYRACSHQHGAGCLVALECS